MDLTQMFLSSPDWVKGMWVIGFTMVTLGVPLIAVRGIAVYRNAPLSPQPRRPGIRRRPDVSEISRLTFENRLPLASAARVGTETDTESGHG